MGIQPKHLQATTVIMCNKVIIIAAGLIFCIGGAKAQAPKKDSASSGVMFNFSYAAQLPGGDLAKRFGFSSDIQLGVYYKSHTNWLIGAQGGAIFGNILRETGMFDSIATKDGNLIANDGNYAQVHYFERGYHVQLSVGKVVPLSKKNLNSGLIGIVGVGYLRHHIRIETPADWTPQASKSYLQGYDRLTAGFCISEFIGYQYMGKHRIINFFAGLDFTQGFTKSLRYDFDLMSKNNKLRYDLLNGIRVGWILPVFKRPATGFYTY